MRTTTDIGPEDLPPAKVVLSPGPARVTEEEPPEDWKPPPPVGFN